MKSLNHPCLPYVSPLLYSRRDKNGNKESWGDVSKRVTEGIAELGNFTSEEKQLCIICNIILKV